MNLKFEALKACMFILIGAFLCSRFLPKPEPQKAESKQEKVAKCKATIIKRENADGSKDEITEFLAESSQKQEVKSESKQVKKNGVGLFKDEVLYKRKVIEDIKLFGLEFDTDAIFKASKDKADAGVMIEF